MRLTPLVQVERKLVEARALVERLTITRDMLRELDEPAREQRRKQKVNGALLAHTSGVAHVKDAPPVYNPHPGGVSHALRELLATKGPLRAQAIEAELKASYTGTAQITNNTIGGRLAQMRRLGVVENTDAGWIVTGKPMGKAGNPGTHPGPNSRAKRNTGTAGKRPPGQRAIDVVMRELAAAAAPLSIQELRARLTQLPSKLIGSTFSTGVRYGRLRQTADGWVITAKGRKEVAQLNGAHP